MTHPRDPVSPQPLANPARVGRGGTVHQSRMATNCQEVTAMKHTNSNLVLIAIGVVLIAVVLILNEVHP